MLCIASVFCTYRFCVFMKRNFVQRCKGFTLVELLVVIAIMGILMTMGASVLRDGGKGRGIDSGIDMLENLVREARATAQGNDTYTRVIIANDPRNTSSDSRHLRYMTVQMLSKEDTQYDGSDVRKEGRWISTSSGMMLPPGVYFSPHYSTPLEWSEGAAGTMIGQSNARLSGRGTSRVYYVEFDEKGRFVSPSADPLTPTRPQRLVLITGRMGRGRNAHDGIIPGELDSQRRPVGAKGIVLWPNGDTSLLRTIDQTIGR